MSTGRQLVEGVSGGRPGSRGAARRPEGRPGSRGGFDGLGRWVENRLDWLLDDSDDWPEPWQERARRRGEAPATPEGRLAPPLSRDMGEPQSRDAEPDRGSAFRADSSGDSRREPLTTPQRNAQPRRRLEAISRRGITPAAAPRAGDGEQDWPDDAAFSLPRWQRPSAALTRPDPLRPEQQAPRPDRSEEGSAPPPARPLPRSTRRR